MHHGAPFVSLPAQGLQPAARAMLDLATLNVSQVPAPNLGGGSCSGFSHKPSLNRLALQWSEGLQVRCGHEITQLSRQDSAWWLQTSGKQTMAGPFEHVLITAPAPQTLSLLSTLSGQDLLRNGLAKIAYAPCWSLLWIPAAPPPGNGFIEVPPAHTGLAMLVREDARDGDVGPIRYAIHATEAWSREHLESTPE
ncbi:MAG: hypothetical protein VW625_10475, partial [Perlucidibaca sp.]